MNKLLKNIFKLYKEAQVVKKADEEEKYEFGHPIYNLLSEAQSAMFPEEFQDFEEYVQNNREKFYNEIKNGKKPSDIWLPFRNEWAKNSKKPFETIPAKYVGVNLLNAIKKLFRETADEKERKDKIEKLYQDGVLNDEQYNYIKKYWKVFERFSSKKTKLSKKADEDKFKTRINEEGDEIGTCAWCEQEYDVSDLKKDKDLGYICDHCARAITSRGEELEIIETSKKQNVCKKAEENDGYITVWLWSGAGYLLNGFATQASSESEALDNVAQYLGDNNMGKYYETEEEHFNRIKEDNPDLSDEELFEIEHNDPTSIYVDNSMGFIGWINSENMKFTNGIDEQHIDQITIIDGPRKNASKQTKMSKKAWTELEKKQVGAIEENKDKYKIYQTMGGEIIVTNHKLNDKYALMDSANTIEEIEDKIATDWEDSANAVLWDSALKGEVWFMEEAEDGETDIVDMSSDYAEETKEAAKRDYTAQLNQVKDIMKEYGYGLTDNGFIYLLKKEEPKDEGFQVKFKGDRLRVELDGKLRYSGFGPQAIEEFLQKAFYAKKVSSKANAMRKRAKNYKEYIWYFNDIMQDALFDNKGNFAKAVEYLLTFASSEYDKARFPREEVYKLVKEYIDDTVKFQEMINHPIKEEYITKAKELLNNYKVENKIATKTNKIYKQAKKERVVYYDNSLSPREDAQVHKVTYYDTAYNTWGDGNADHEFISAEQFEKETGKKIEELKEKEKITIKLAKTKNIRFNKKATKTLEEVAVLIDTILDDFDHYGYSDTLEVDEFSGYERILADLQKDEKKTIEETLNYIAEDDSDEPFTSKELDQLKEYYNSKFGKTATTKQAENKVYIAKLYDKDGVKYDNIGKSENIDELKDLLRDWLFEKRKYRETNSKNNKFYLQDKIVIEDYYTGEPIETIKVSDLLSTYGKEYWKPFMEAKATKKQAILQVSENGLGYVLPNGKVVYPGDEAYVKSELKGDKELLEETNAKIIRLEKAVEEIKKEYPNVDLSKYPDSALFKLDRELKLKETLELYIETEEDILNAFKENKLPKQASLKYYAVSESGSNFGSNDNKDELKEEVREFVVEHKDNFEKKEKIYLKESNTNKIIEEIRVRDILTPYGSKKWIVVATKKQAGIPEQYQNNAIVKRIEEMLAKMDMNIKSIEGRGLDYKKVNTDGMLPGASSFSGKSFNEILKKITDYYETSRYNKKATKKTATIKHENGVYNVYSESGKCLGKGYKTKEEAEKRLKQVEYFKHKDKKAATGYDFYGPKKMPETDEGTFRIKYYGGPGKIDYLRKSKNGKYHWVEQTHFDYNNDKPFETTDYELAKKLVDQFGGEIEKKESKQLNNKKKSLKDIVISKMAGK